MKASSKKIRSKGAFVFLEFSSQKDTQIHGYNDTHYEIIGVDTSYNALPAPSQIAHFQLISRLVFSKLHMTPNTAAFRILLVFASRKSSGIGGG